MDIAVLEIFKENTIAFGIASILVLISFAIKTLAGFLSFHEEFLVKRYVKRLDSLSKDIDIDSTTAKYFKALRMNEFFRIASGIECSPEKAKMLMDVYLLGVVSRSDLKGLAQYLKPENDQISIAVNHGDQFVFFYSFSSMLGFFSFGIYHAISSLITCKLSQIFAGIVIMIIFMLAGSFLGREHTRRLSLIRVRDQLIRRDMVINPDNWPDWNITL